jgi:hypothetical protein
MIFDSLELKMTAGHCVWRVGREGCVVGSHHLQAQTHSSIGMFLLSCVTWSRCVHTCENAIVVVLMARQPLLFLQHALHCSACRDRQRASARLSNMFTSIHPFAHSAPLTYMCILLYAVDRVWSSLSCAMKTQFRAVGELLSHSIPSLVVFSVQHESH